MDYDFYDVYRRSYLFDLRHLSQIHVTKKYRTGTLTERHGWTLDYKWIAASFLRSKITVVQQSYFTCRLNSKVLVLHQASKHADWGKIIYTVTLQNMFYQESIVSHCNIALHYCILLYRYCQYNVLWDSNQLMTPAFFVDFHLLKELRKAGLSSLFEWPVIV